MNIFAISSLLCASSSFLLAVFCAFEEKVLRYRLLLWFNVAVFLWGFGLFVVAASGQPDLALMGWKIAYLGGIFIAPIFFHLICDLCEFHRPKILWIGYGQAIIFNLLNTFTDLLMKPIHEAFGFHYISYTPLLTLALIFFLFLLSLSYIEMAKCLKTVEGFRKRQIQYVFFGFGFGFVGGLSVLLPEFFINLIYPAGNFGVFIYATIVSYAMLRHKIFDPIEMAKAAHRDKLAAIATLAASINHEIRNPLYIIQGLAESHLVNVNEGIFATDQTACKKANEILRKIADQATRAMEIMKRFAIFAKREIAPEANTVTVHLNDTIQTVLPLVRHELELDKIDLKVDVPSNLPPVKADPRQLEEILFNLIMNACQAFSERSKIQDARLLASLKLRRSGPDGQAGSKNSSRSAKGSTWILDPGSGINSHDCIQISAEQHNGSVSISIKDNGPGIARENLRRIFEPFYTTKSEGTGLGLYITKQLIEKNRGKISVKSKPGEATTFHLEFKR